MRYEVRVKLGQDFIREEGGVIIVGVKARPEKGKANAEIIKKLAAYFKVPGSRVNLVFGLKAKKKIAEIE
jgi:hypothetical protein